jgi:hypothetical protein
MTPKTGRLIEASARIAMNPPTKEDLCFQHTVLCQTSLPHRPTAARTWERTQGNVSLLIEGGRIRRDGHWVEMPLPHGEMPRLLLIYLNSEAMRTGSPFIDVERTMTAFIRSLGIETNGAQIREFKEQTTRLAAANIRFAVSNEVIQGQLHVVHMQELQTFSLWRKGRNQRIEWPTKLRLSEDYFKALEGRAVPLDHRAVATLKGSSLCLDIYAWLAQRLHRIPPGRPQDISWAALKEQFGAEYKRERDFRSKFARPLQEVLSVYPDADVEQTERGLTLCHSPPPISKRLIKGGLPA